MTKPQSAALGRGMRHIEEAVFRAITTRGVELKDHYFSWHNRSSAIRHTDVHQLALHLRDGRVLSHRFSIEELEHASNGVIDVDTLPGVHSIAQTASPPPKREYSPATRKTTPFRFLNDEELENLSDAERFVYFIKATKNIHPENQPLLDRWRHTHKPKATK
jgi:hypothetical protein